MGDTAFEIKCVEFTMKTKAAKGEDVSWYEEHLANLGKLQKAQSKLQVRCNTTRSKTNGK
uniref:Uncharacterized protein n=1 Tax=viral metagenome TaxID=1070528 RepID=A0A6M3IWI3_9ZZZZ